LGCQPASGGRTLIRREGNGAAVAQNTCHGGNWHAGSIPFRVKIPGETWVAKTSVESVPELRAAQASNFLKRRFLLGVQEVPSSNLGSPTKFLKVIQTAGLLRCPFGVQLESKRDAGPFRVSFGPRSRSRFSAYTKMRFFEPKFPRTSLLLIKPDKPDKSHVRY
jgi:hypothetical protein